MSLCYICQEALQCFPPGEHHDLTTLASDGDGDGIETTTITRQALSQSQTWRRRDYHYPGRLPQGEEPIVWETNNALLMHSSWKGLMASLNDDCPICWTVWRSLRSSPTAKPADEALPGFQTKFTEISCEPAFAKYNVTITVCSDKSLDLGMIVVADQILPPSYRDVIDICRAISIRYLWIDSLCIVQDDGGADFRKEAPLMTNIYADAFLTVTICWDTGERSVFHECRPRSIPRPGRVASWQHDNADSNDHVISHADHFVLVQEHDPSDFNTCVNYADINRRAWVVQERLLSRRILYLGNDQLYWECDGFVANEVSPLGIYHYQKRYSLQNLTDRFRDRPWGLTLEKYTSCDLTYEEDRLVAIAGLAKAVSASTGETFFAGIWLENWMEDLFWTPKTEEDILCDDFDAGIYKTHKRSAIATSSWSWLDYPGSIIAGHNVGGPRIPLGAPETFESDIFRPLSMLCRTRMLPLAIDPIAAFDKAVLEIRCLLIPAKFDSMDTIVPQHKQNMLGQGIIVQADNNLKHLLFRPDGQTREVAISVRFSRPINDPDSIFLLPLYITTPTSSLPFMAGIIVQEVLGCKEREFTRVGHWTEHWRFPSQLVPMVLNTIVRNNIGTNISLSDDASQEQMRALPR
ncbi:uncharacterized protein B0J16DRAFT_353402 [Fusarium flagelliforme]|uniref:uncharacterized protein n=1 Tax=Fusarium flagelliforme TaxID=2675880 RepID=UPI001E8D9551|nr:uncharacterized protein B0J16DRAFT_353402 [Fusarium flagelliforme]KAH7191702.1 hypothetical protein B0J16DRAFT_353402 [Fusarium flagelliforme]